MPNWVHAVVLFLVLTAVGGDVAAQHRSLLQSRGAFVAIKPQGDAETGAPNSQGGASLFAGRAGASLFADPPPRPDAAAPARRVARFAVPVSRQVAPGSRALRFETTRGQMEQLRGLIRNAESRRDGYDAVQHGARIKPPQPPTRMTLAQIDRWIDDTPRQPHAIGKYQFIPKTLRRLVQAQNLPPDTRFSPAIQDQLADQLLAEAGLRRFLRGELSRHGFMNNLAKIWAGFPNSSGRSHYHGYAGNKASVTWAHFDAQIKAIFPRQG